MSQDTIINWAVRPESGSLTVKLFGPDGLPVIEPTEVDSSGWNSGDITVTQTGDYCFTYTWTSGYQRMVSGSLGNFLDIGGATYDFHVEGEALSNNCQFMFSLPVVEIPKRSKVTYTVDNGNIIPDARYIPAFAIIGADVKQGGTGPDVPVTMEVQFENQRKAFEPFGPFDNPKTGAINDDQVGISQRAHICRIFDANQAMNVTCQSWRQRRGKIQPYQTINSGPALKILQPGGKIPQIPGYNGQPSIQEFLDAVGLSNGKKVNLQENQAVLCYELGGRTSGSAADYQDALILVTLFPAI